MVLSLDEIKAMAACLPDEQQAELAHHLLHSLETVDPKVRKEWLELADIRMAEIRAGKMAGLPADLPHNVPNRSMLEAIARIEDIQKGMSPQKADETLKHLSEAREGAMYGHGSNE